jgi:hypothetical protein
VEVAAPASREQAEKAASMLLVLKKMEKELVARLKEWVKANGAIQAGDMVYGPNQVISYDLDPEQVISVLLKAGLAKIFPWKYREDIALGC